MVHALREIRRVLKPDGLLIDLRPLAGQWPVEVVTGRDSHVAGHILDLPAGLADDQAANQAIQQAAHQGWFVLEGQEFFPFFYYWDSPNEMQEYIDEEWAAFAEIDEQDWRDIRSRWSSANADARVRVRVNMQIGRWKRSGQPG